MATAAPAPTQAAQPTNQPGGGSADYGCGIARSSGSSVARDDRCVGGLPGRRGSASGHGRPAQAAPPAQASNPYDTVIRVYRDARPSVVTVVSSTVQPGFRSEPEPQGTGPGFIIDNQGHILTNSHVVADANRLEVTLATGTTLPAEAHRAGFALRPRRDPGPHPRRSATRADPGDSDKVQVGEQVVAIGNPYGLDGTVTQGSSAAAPACQRAGAGRRAGQRDPDRRFDQPWQLRRPAVQRKRRGHRRQHDRADAESVPGRAELRHPDQQCQAYPGRPDGRGSYAHPFVGIATAEITSQVASTLGLTVQEGLLIQSVEPNSGAARAGLRGGSQQQREVGSRQVAAGGDIIIAIDGQKLRRPEDFIAYLELNKKAGDITTLTIIRDREQRDVQVTLGERPRPEPRQQEPRPQPRGSLTCVRTPTSRYGAFVYTACSISVSFLCHSIVAVFKDIWHRYDRRGMMPGAA